jgi:ribosome-associated protein
MQADAAPNTLDIAPGLAVPVSLLTFTFSRSSGPGGQNVNKLNTKATLSLKLEDLGPYVSAAVLERLRRLGGSRVTEDGRLMLTCDESRSQHANKAACVERLRQLIIESRHIPRRRRRTRPSRAAKERRLQSKKQRGQIKQSRQQRFD